MEITFYGAAREVTGSMHMIASGSNRILLDSGMFQGRRKEAEEKNKTLAFDPGTITNILLSHAHIDHCGRIPMLTKDSFRGRIICTDATADACEYLLMDSAHIQESDADYLNYKTVRNFLNRLKSSSDRNAMSPREVKDTKKLLKQGGHKLNREKIIELVEKYDLKKIQPLYTKEDARTAMGYFDGYPYKHPITIGDGMTCTLYEAGHILGSAIIMVRVREAGRDINICFTGDFGRFEKPILKDPTLNFADEDRDVDLLIMESTYGNRTHGPVADLKNQLREVIVQTLDRGGSVVIPSFAFGRAQELIYVLHELYEDGEVPRIPVYLDSPLASNLTKVFGEHPEIYDKETHETFLESGKNPFAFKQMKFVTSVEESMALNRSEKPAIIIASSGMCEGGRILHHLRHKIHNEKNTILIVGYMAANTLGRRLLDLGSAYEKSGRSGPPPMLRFYNKEHPLKAHVLNLGGFSAHGDKNELIRLVKASNLSVKKVAVVHGEEEQALAFADSLKAEGLGVTVPRMGETLSIG